MAQSLQEKREARRRRRNEEGTEEEEKGLTEGKGRATPSRRKGEIGGSSTGSSAPAFLKPFNRVRDYFEGVRSEIEKVTWPDAEETNRLTRIVMAVLLVSALFLGGLSILFTEIFNLGINNPWVFVVVFVAFIALLFAYARFSAQSESAEF